MVHDWPFRVDLILAGLVLTHALLTLTPLLTVLHIPRLFNVWKSLAEAGQDSVRDLYIAMLGPSAIVAGFAGVVVVFGLTTDAPRFRQFRADAGDSLKRTWVSSSLSGFLAGLGFVAATITSLAGANKAAPFIFELSVLVLAHGAIRLLWILRELVGIKTADDITAVQEENKVPLSSLPWNRNRSVS